jgi:hypothetical protein
MSEVIRSLVTEGELTDWTVALIGGGDGKQVEFRNGVSVDMLQRSAHIPHADRYSIRRLMSPRDETIDLDEAAWKAALAVTRTAFHADPARSGSEEPPDAPNGPAIRRIRGLGAEGVPARPERGVLFIYAIDPELAGPEAGLPPGVPAVVAFAISFPDSKSGTKVEYKVNNVAWEQEYGAVD